MTTLMPPSRRMSAACTSDTILQRVKGKKGIEATLAGVHQNKGKPDCSATHVVTMLVEKMIISLLRVPSMALMCWIRRRGAMMSSKSERTSAVKGKRPAQFVRCRERGEKTGNRDTHSLTDRSRLVYRADIGGRERASMSLAVRIPVRTSANGLRQGRTSECELWVGAYVPRIAVR